MSDARVNRPLVEDRYSENDSILFDYAHSWLERLIFERLTVITIS
jgi:hypothetical protein